MDPNLIHRRVEYDEALCVYAGLNEADDEKPIVTDDLDAVTCTECLRLDV